MDEAIKYKVNIGENGNKFGVRKFDVNLIIAEYWSDKGRAFGINIAGKDVVLRFIGPKKNQAMITTFKNNKVRQSRTSTEIHLLRLEGQRPIFIGLEIYPPGTGLQLVDVQGKLTTTWGQIKQKKQLRYQS